MQISKRAFRYFKNENHSYRGMPIVAFRKKIILKATPYTVNKTSYLKQGSKVYKSHKEDLLFENMFEIILTEDYEDNAGYRDQERAISNLKQR